MRCAVRREHAGLELAAFLGARFPYHTAEDWARLAAEGAVLLNDAPPPPGRLLAEGDIVRYMPAGGPEPRVDTAFTVLYEDRDIVVVDKPGNLPAHPAGRYFKHTLWWALKERLGITNPGVINRLDRETSGVTLVAKNPIADRSCRAQFSSRGVTKKYIAIVEGAFPGPLLARGYMSSGSTAVIRKKQLFEPAAGPLPEPGRESQWAETAFTLLERKKDLSVVEAVPHTGRLHQIRATLLALGFPLAGDKIYGLDEGVFPRFLEDRLTEGDAAKMRLGRQALHAAELSFRHPSDGRAMTVKAPLPADMSALLG